MHQGKLNDMIKENKNLSKDLQKARAGTDTQARNTVQILEAERLKREDAERQLDKSNKQNADLLIKLSELAALQEAARDQAADCTRTASEKTQMLEEALAKLMELQKQVEYVL